MKSNKSSKEKTSRSIVKSRNLNSGTLTKITEVLLVGRKVPKKELGQYRDSERKSIVLVP